jgi:predicted nucleic acid-binding Zn ribbon protein
MSSPTIPCPSCGKPTGGKFCRHCGASVGTDRCAKCGSPIAPQARFCSQCGSTVAAAAAVPATRNERVLWFLAGGGLVLLVGGGALALSRSGTPSASAAAAAEAPFAGGAGDGGAGAPPDISNMSPRERFDRLFNRIMRAAESGDANTVTTFAPMAIQAYGLLDTVDADARYHLALIQLHTGDVDGARAQGDSILKQTPGHLFGYVVKGTIARFQKDDKALARTYADFLAHYDAEQAKQRPEYAEHPRALEEFLKAAREAKGGSGS